MVAQRNRKALVYTLHHRLRASDTGQTMLKARTAVPDVICSSRPWQALTLALALVLTACGGGGGSPSDATAGSGSQVSYPASDDEARRFLTQATFGPTDVAVGELKDLGFERWIQKQLVEPRALTHLQYFDERNSAIKIQTPTSQAWFNEVNQSFWSQAIFGPDQLRQRAAFALSEIFVVSAVDGCGANNPRAIASYLDMLAESAFGDFRELIEKVAMHPIMGCYLSHLRNQRENSLTGRVPDENFARELLQLFSIGLYKLNADGSMVLDQEGNPIETYGPSDVAGLAKVFTGFSFDCPDWPDTSCFYWGSNGGAKLQDPWVVPMMGYPQFHSYETPKNFLGYSIPAATRPDPAKDLSLTLDHLALKHPNVGPFIGKQLIQRLVTSNPSPAYVARVTSAFERSGRNMGAMFSAILLDPEARNFAEAKASNTFGKIREPVLRLSALMRAVGVTSDSGLFYMDPTDDVQKLYQSPLLAPSVFNFFRPGYVYPQGETAKLGLVAPELQIINESSIAGYANYMKDVVASGVGRWRTNTNGVARYDIRLNYTLDTSNDWYVLAKNRDASPLIEFINQKLMYGLMTEPLKSEIKSAVESLALSATPTETQARSRLHAAILLTMVSPEYIVQK
jgi:uncharacterized protein (DUF1800 family)